MRGLAAAMFLFAAACATAPKPVEQPPPKKVQRAPPKRVEPPPVEQPVEEPAEETPVAERELLGEGLASYYADSLAGNRTASGERYQPDRRTCAHRTLPFGTMLRITAKRSGRSSTCRVNDRGPFTSGRMLDVSKLVARELGMVDAGVIEVRIERAVDGDT